MPTTLTPEQIIALASDPGVAQSGRGLANLRKWQNLGQSDRAIWGECQGSGKDPYRVQVDLSEPAFRCTCPSRKFPCKHGVGLMLLLAAQASAFAAGDPPAWVAEWLAKRNQSKKPAHAPDTEAAPAPQKRASSPARVAAREALVAGGLDDLARWLRDQMRQGLVAAQSRPASDWDAMAARMVDAQAPGVARMLRGLAGVAFLGEGWQARLLERLALIHLLIEGYRRRNHLAPDLLLEVRTQIGWQQDQEVVRAGPAIRDHWHVIGQRLLEEDQLRVARTWLWGASSGRAALILSFAAPGQQLDRSAVPGTQINADLAFFGGSFPLRALILQRHAAPSPIQAPLGYPTITAALGAYAGATSQNPWLEYFPWGLLDVTLLRDGERWLVRDSNGCVLGVRLAAPQGWRVLALGGGRPLALFGEWDGTVFTPLSVWAEGSLQNLEG